MSIRHRTLKKNGMPGRVSKSRLSRQEISHLESPADRELAGLLIGNEADWSTGYYSGYSTYGGYGQEYSGAFVNAAMVDVIFPRLCSLGTIRPDRSRPGGQSR